MTFYTIWLLGCSPASHLGAGHSDLWAGVDVDATVGLSGDGAAHCVGDAHSQGPPLLTVTEGHEAVCRFTWWGSMES